MLVAHLFKESACPLHYLFDSAWFGKGYIHA